MTNKLMLLTVVEVAGMFVVIGLVMFFSAGTAAWPTGWVFLIAFFVFVAALTLWLLGRNPDLLRERLTGIGMRDQKAWDKVFLGFANVFFFGWLVLMSLDAARFHWSRMPLALQIVGAILLLCSFYLFFATFRENSYLSPAVRMQRERGHTVVSTGPYRYVRHPMYAAFLVFMCGSALLLGSWWGLLLGLIIVAGTALRALGEERMLRAELDGYAAYMARVRYRLIPYIW